MEMVKNFDAENLTQSESVLLKIMQLNCTVFIL
jgi:hypothetical protein